MDLSSAVNQMYKSKEQMILLGLTGRTGSGCSTVARILEAENISNLDLKQYKEYDYNNVQERKNKVVYNYMCQNNRWEKFTVIEVSSVILACALEKGKDKFIEYINSITSEDNGCLVSIGEKEKLINTIKNLDETFRQAQECKLDSSIKINDLCHDGKIDPYYDFYVRKIKKIKKSFKDILEGFTCFEIIHDKSRGKQQKQYHLYTYIMQQMGNNVRSSGDPFNDSFEIDKYREFVERLERIIEIISEWDKRHKTNGSRICIDAIRNPYEAVFLKDKYRSFHLMAINTDDKDRKRRLKELNHEELLNLDNIEYPQKLKEAQEIFYHQNIQECLEKADIHVYNPDINNGKYYDLTEQLLKYVALMLHPGLITPTHLERCMQLAYNAKFNSGCLSRQVGAVVTREDYSIQSIGWNDVPKGQVSCNLRDVQGYCKNKDEESFSQYEIETPEFQKAMERINEMTQGKTGGRCMSYCFKDVYNGLKKDRNQVYTRSLHAEENAFLQISKYGGTPVTGGYLFTTASPCELCAKKAYQLGIRKIYYIDPYPGISPSHILKFGRQDNPEMILFQGAIGSAYLDFYEQRIALKDEFELLTGVNVKKTIGESTGAESLAFGDIEYKHMDIALQFHGEYGRIDCIRNVSGIIKRDGIKRIKKHITWTGSSYNGVSLNKERSDDDITLQECNSDELPYIYEIIFAQEKKAGDIVQYEINVSLNDEKKVMEPYLAHMVKSKIDNLSIALEVPPNLVKDVVKTVYADLEMKTLVDKKSIETEAVNAEDDLVKYMVKIEKPNVNYTYAIEWKFGK